MRTLFIVAVAVLATQTTPLSASGGAAETEADSAKAADSTKTTQIAQADTAPPTKLPKQSRREPRTATFQNGFDGYTGTVDTEIWALAPKTFLHKNPNASSDANNDGGESQVLMRFDAIIGTKPGQIPPSSTIVKARLIVSAFDQGTTVNLHRMLVPFEECATWDSMVSGVSADGFEASRHKDGFTFGKVAASSSGAIFDVRDTVQLWVNGRKNHGWVFLNTGGNGWDFYVSEFERKDQHPKLVVEYLPPSDSKTELANITKP